MSTRRASFRQSTFYPAINTAVAGVLAALLADSIGGPGVTVGLAVALALWTWQIVAALPAVKPMPAPVMMASEQVVTIRVRNLDSTQEDADIFGVSPEVFQKFAERALTTPLRSRSFAGIVSQAAYGNLIAELCAQGWARRENPSDPHSGHELTAKGRASMRGLTTAPLSSELAKTQ